MITIGSTAPGFRAPSSKGHTLDAAAFLGKVPVVLVFVPDPSGATGQLVLSDLDEHLVAFGHERVQVLGVLPWSPRAVRDLADEAQMALPLLADESGAIRAAFLGGDRAEPGRTAAERTPYAVLIDCDGTIAGSYQTDESTGFSGGLRERVDALIDPDV